MLLRIYCRFLGASLAQEANVTQLPLTTPPQQHPHSAFPSLLYGTDTREFRDLSASQRDFILGFIHTLNPCIVFDSRVEDSNEAYDRTWRRWLGFCSTAGRASDPFLTLLSLVGRELFV
jgi:hypothetical protein